MKIESSPENGDHPEFIRRVNHLLDSMLNEHAVEDVYTVRISNWFGEKWLGFSGKDLGALGIWNTDLTLPPFHPNRVLEESCYKRDAASKFLPQRDSCPQLHRAQSSGENLNRKIVRVSRNAVFLWFSSNSKSNKRGSVMAYIAKTDECLPIYVELTEGKSWRIAKARGVNNLLFNEISQL